MPPATPRIALHVLGAPALRIEGVSVAAGSRKSLALLAWLALEGRSTRARLASLFWPELDAASARRNLRRELHRLREAGVDAALQADGDTLALAATVEVDVAAFEQALERGDVAAALALYGGPLLAGFDAAAAGDFDAWAGAQRERLAQRHRDAVQAQAGLHEAAGRWRDALDATLRLIELDGLHEQHFRHAMRLHARLGERESALALYERCRQRLGRELGLRPLPETAALAEAIRGGGAGPDAPAPRPLPAATWPAQLPLVGRDEVLATLQAAAAGPWVWLQGEAGIGKTRLALEAAARLGRHLRVSALPGDRDLPYATLARALRTRLGAQAAAALPTWVRRDLAHILPELGPVPRGLAGDADRLRLHAAVVAAWQLLMPTDLRALVLDDWHLADGATQALWPQLPTGQARVFVTLRAADLAAPAQAALQRARHGGAARVLDLPPLPPAGTAALLQALGAPPRPALVRRLQAATGGNPFFLQETLRHLLQAGALHDAADDDARALPLPPTVRDAVLARLDGIGEGARRLLEAASLTDGAFDVDELDGCTALAAFERVDAVEQALQRHVLQRGDDGLLRFRHALLAQALADALLPERRRLLHRSLAAALERRGAAPARIARHLALAGAAAESRCWHLAAADAAEALAAHDAALAELQAAVAEAPPAEALAIRLRMAQVLRRAGRPHDADAAFDAAEQVALRAGQGAAAVLLARAEHLGTSTRLDEAAGLVDALLDDGLLDARQQVQALEIRADLRLKRGDVAGAGAGLAQALQRLPAGASPLRGRLLTAQGRVAMLESRFDAAAQLFERAARVLAVAGDAEGHARATFMHGAAEMNRARFPQAEALLERARELGARAGSVPVQRGAILNHVKILTQRGEVARARALLAAGEALSPVYESREAEAAFVQARYYCQLLDGDHAAARAGVAAVLATGDACGELYWRVGARQLVADLLLLTGELDTVQRVLDEACALADGGRDDFHHPLLQAKQAWLALLRGRPTDALQRLQVLGAVEAMPSAEAQDVRRHVEAAARLALGDAAGALALVADPDASSTDESRLLQWAQRLHAEAAMGGWQPATRAAVDALLAQPQRLPVLERQVLRRARGLPPD